MLRFLAEERGATSAEYVLILALVGLGAFVAVPSLPDVLVQRFSGAADVIQQYTRYLGY